MPRTAVRPRADIRQLTFNFTQNAAEAGGASGIASRASTRTNGALALRDMLVQNRHDMPNDPKLDGSWDPLDREGKKAGRACSTAMSCLCLEVYYRYLPMYK